ESAECRGIAGRDGAGGSEQSRVWGRAKTGCDSRRRRGPRGTVFVPGMHGFDCQRGAANGENEGAGAEWIERVVGCGDWWRAGWVAVGVIPRGAVGGGCAAGGFGEVVKKWWWPKKWMRRRGATPFDRKTRPCKPRVEYPQVILIVKR